MKNFPAYLNVHPSFGAGNLAGIRVGPVPHRRAAAMLVVMILALSTGRALNAETGDSPSFAYLLHCAGCHLENGAGDPPDIPDLREELGLLLTVPEGRHYALRVPGVTDAQVTEKQMAALMTWLITRLYPDKEGFEPFTAAEVIAGRENRLSDPVRYRNELLVKLTGTAELPEGSLDSN